MPYAIKEREYQRQWRLANKDRINAKRRERRHNHREQENAYRRGWRGRHPEIARYHEEIFWEKVKAIWGSSGSRPPREVYKKVELYALMNVLPSLGFTDIAYLKNDPGFTFDFLASFRGEKCFIDVTSAARRTVTKKLKLARLIGFSFFVLFISPNLKFHYLQDMTNVTHSWAHVPWSVLKGFIASEADNGNENSSGKGTTNCSENYR